MPDMIPILRTEDMLVDYRYFEDSASGALCPACLLGWLSRLSKKLPSRMEDALCKRTRTNYLAHWNMNHTKAENARLRNSCIADVLGDYDVVDDEKENRWGRA